MDVHPVDLLFEVDKVFDARTPDDEVKLARDKVRRYLRGNIASVTIRHLVISQPTNRRSDPLLEKVDRLQQQVSELETEKAELEAQIQRLREQVNKADHQFTEPSDGFYTMEQFLVVLMRRLRRSYGWRTDYVLASINTPNCTPVPNETVQKWKNCDQVPAWAVEQIERLDFRERSGTSGVPWSRDDEAYLAEQYLANPRRSNLELALMCKDKFKRHITENAVKGSIDRQRKRGDLPKKRPAHTS